MCIKVVARIHSTDESDTHFDVSHAVLPPRMAWVHGHVINVKSTNEFHKVTTCCAEDRVAGSRNQLQEVCEPP